ncbi:two-component response regulator-like APRR5 isoform X2 [Daucus carota subsp. sativus]|uniref:two-component response regulator-like APRR5 isoform X2 n=1 Tax=Daucus carota subsp. sativus TaxID=79200 RepID=UPI0007EEF722|nr:PREDICTED: two-component response regulator-like APRR5 isoform X2 [Daucus carota subsp. sativus]
MENQEEESKNDGVVRWEKFLPKMVMRVLLVESDDSTRQLITALLRKCSYKVAAVADGLKAWELLKGRPQNVDLILTEVELPSISGFALLTLIAEHDVCKNIPVIMMSAHDSVNTVYKCMLRGAADFLVKPVRKNELKNLWQHVWRRQSSVSEGPQATSDAQQKVEATAENDAASNHSSGYEACVQRNRECIEKGSDAQSSCTKPDLEAVEANLGHKQDLTQQKQKKSLISDIRMQKFGQCVKESAQILMHGGDAYGLPAVPNTTDMSTSSRDNVAADGQWKCAIVSSETLDKNNVRADCSREAIDLIGSFDKYPTRSNRSLGSTYGTNKVDSSSLLDLTLRRSHPSGSVNQDTDDGHKLKQSDASAFSRYVSNRTIQPPHSTSASTSNRQKGYETSSDKQRSNQAFDYNSDTRAPAIGPDFNNLSLITSQLGQGEIQSPSPQQRVVIPVTVPVRGVNLGSQSNVNRSAIPSVFFSQSTRSQLQSPNSTNCQNPAIQVNQSYPFDSQTKSSPQLLYVMDQNANVASPDQMDHKQGHKLDISGDRGHISSATDQSGSSSFCNSTLNRINSINNGNNSNANLYPNVKFGPMSGSEVTALIKDGSHHSTRREAALTKFRMKRKDRCFEKKVRYESRKKLAEQRPRVKGQFVRQLQGGDPSIETDNHNVDSSAS